MVTGAEPIVICCVNLEVRCTDAITSDTINNRVSTVFGVFSPTKVRMEPPKLLYMRSQMVFS